MYPGSNFCGEISEYYMVNNENMTKTNKRIAVRAKLIFLYSTVLIPVILTLMAHLETPLPFVDFKAAAPLSIFISPAVFQNSTYLHKRGVTLNYSSGEIINFDQEQLLELSYELPHRFAGVILWHFIKYSSRLSNENMHASLDILFCQHGNKLGIVDAQKKLQKIVFWIDQYPNFQNRKILEHSC